MQKIWEYKNKQKKTQKKPKSYDSEITTVNNLVYFLKKLSLHFYISHNWEYTEDSNCFMRR